MFKFLKKKKIFEVSWSRLSIEWYTLSLILLLVQLSTSLPQAEQIFVVVVVPLVFADLVNSYFWYGFVCYFSQYLSVAFLFIHLPANFTKTIPIILRFKKNWSG